MKKFLGVVFSVMGLMLVSAAAHAGDEAYSGSAGEKVVIESAPQLGKNVYLIKITGLHSKWNNHVIRAVQSMSGDQRPSYSFDYTLSLSDGDHKKTCTLISGIDDTLINGTLTKQIELWYPEGRNQRIKLAYDPTTTAKSQDSDLAGEFKKSPYQPEMD